ncbi:ephrin-4-like isoform X2 [Ruditapes philippinarum]|uniref:ephrin-4-like isoform X2 n=1 Tax=Ruditapes philippinarum TaxID=129788 RepID=UPI00295AC6EA|nr:ephrin-4-like isoform X2 [Ruditapes philippinarum]
MSKCTWLDYIFKLLLMLLWTSLVTPGMGRASNIRNYYYNWTRENEKFHVEGTAHMNIPLLSNLVILCPVNTTPAEYYRVYWVNEEGFNGCFLPPQHSQLLVDCDDPTQAITFTYEFKRFSGVPGGKDFEPGQNYYIATFSTGTKNGFTNELYGACKESNLRLNITILNQTVATTPKPTDRPVSTTESSTSRRTTRTTKYTTRSTTVVTTPSTTTSTTSRRPRTTDIPVITVPDTPGGNTGVIDISSAQTLSVPSALVLSLCLSLLHILYLNVPLIQR